MRPAASLADACSATTCDTTSARPITVTSDATATPVTAAATITSMSRNPLRVEDVE